MAPSQPELNSLRLQAVALLVFAALTAASLVPQTSWAAIWFLPIPIIVFTALKSLWWPAGLSAVFTICLLIAGYGLSSIALGFAIFFIGWVMGDSVKKRESPYAPIVVGSLVIIMLELVLFALLRWLGLTLNEIVSQSLQQASVATGFHGGSPSSWNSIVGHAESSVRLFLPGGVCIFGFLIATLNLLAARQLLRGATILDEDGRERTIELHPLLGTWRLPYGVAIVYLAALVCYLFGIFAHHALLWQAVNSAALVSGFLVAIQGLAFIWRRLGTRKIRYLILIPLVILGAGIRLVGQLYIVIGIMDMISHERKRDV